MGMDFSSAQTWVILAIAVLVVLGLIGHFGQQGDKKKQSAGTPASSDARMAVQASMLAAMSAAASRFDRDMYIDDMTEDQLRDEHVWRTAYITGYNIVGNLGPERDNPFEKICTAITGRPADRQLAGLTEYYYDTVYEPMMAIPDDRYWDDELIARKDQWTPEKREEIVLAALVPLQMANELHIAIRKKPLDEADNGGAHLIPYIDRVGEAFFGAQAPDKMTALRAQAVEMARTIEL